jgi:hypothetical protein
MSLLANLKQLSYPSEFRIADPKWPELASTIKDILRLIEIESYQSELDTEKSDDLLGVVSYIGTTIWRLQVRSTEEIDGSEQIRRVSRDIKAAWDVMTQGGIKIKDHTGKAYDTGMALRVLAFQPMAGLSREKVIQTIKPTIYHKDKVIQIGEVIVGTPLKDIMSKKSNNLA